MNCLITKGRKESCKSFWGGIKEFYIFYKNDAKIYVNSDNIVYDITSSTGGPITLTKFQLMSGCKFSQNLNSDNFNKFYEQTFEANFKGIDNELNSDINKLFQKFDIALLIQTNNGDLLLSGKENGHYITARNDSDSYSSVLTFTAKEKNLAYFVTGGTLDYLLTPPVFNVTFTSHFLDGNLVDLYLNYLLQGLVYSGITLNQGDGYTSHDEFTNREGFLWIECVTNENDFQLEYFNLGDGNCYYIGP